MRGQESKYETDSLIKIGTNVMFIQMSAKSDINNFLDEAVSAMVKEYKKIENGTMEGKPVVTPIDSDKLSYEYNSMSIDILTL